MYNGQCQDRALGGVIEKCRSSYLMSTLDSASSTFDGISAADAAAWFSYCGYLLFCHVLHALKLNVFHHFDD